MTPDQFEEDCAEALLGYAYNLALTYNHNPGDMDAAMVGLIARALEIHVERPINISGMYQ
jgi:hypothetical protein